MGKESALLHCTFSILQDSKLLYLTPIGPMFILASAFVGLFCRGFEASRLFPLLPSERVRPIQRQQTSSSPRRDR